MRRAARLGYCGKCGRDVVTDYCDHCMCYVQPSPNEEAMSEPTKEQIEAAREIVQRIFTGPIGSHIDLAEWLASREAAARAEEREACARIVETWAQDNETIQPSFGRIAAAIRARGERVSGPCGASTRALEMGSGRKPKRRD